MSGQPGIIAGSQQSLGSLLPFYIVLPYEYPLKHNVITFDE
jgi:hypothetical protein